MWSTLVIVSYCCRKPTTIYLFACALRFGQGEGNKKFDREDQPNWLHFAVFAIVTVIVFSLVHARLFRCSSVFTSCSSSPNIYLIIKPRFPQICTLFSSPSALLQKLGHWRAAYDIWLGEVQWRETIRRKNGRNAAPRYLVTLVGRLVTTITPFSTVTPWLSVHLVHVPSQRKLFTSLDESNARVICCIEK